MATSFPDYQQLVMQSYEQKMVSGTLPHGLKYLTPGKLKDECIKRCTKEVNRRDEKIIRDFCGDLNEAKNCYAIMQRCDTDRFRPLVNYLKRKSENTEEKNIELLAWLIDFAGRPWELGKTIPIDVNEDPALNDEGLATEGLATEGQVATQVITPATGSDQSAISEIPTVPVSIGGPKEQGGTEVNIIQTSGPQKLKGSSAKRLANAVILSLVMGTGGALWWKEKNHTGDCMYWQEDHYEPVACDQKIPHTMIIALDAMKLKDFRKITRPDTITYQDIGKVWYSKIDTNMEYFTSAGEHPVVFGRQLKPITAYIIDKHIKHILTGEITK